MKSWKKWLAMALAVAVVTPGQFVAQTSTITAEANETVWLTDEDLSDEEVTAPEKWGAVPNEEQLWYMKEGLAAFCHFGPNTYNDVEWGQEYGTQSPSQIFHLDNAFAADQLVKDVKEAGFGRLILTCKHHDGLCLWDTKTTNYSVAKTENADAYGGDILEALSDACTKYNVDMGCYLSPWDIHEDKYGCFGSQQPLEGGYVNKEYTDYNDLYIAQIREICTAVKTDEEGNPILDEEGNPVYKYGNNHPDRRSDRFVEWWMDGATGATDAQPLDWTGIIGAIRETNPNCQIFGTGKAAVAKSALNLEADRPLASTGGIHWIGNESGFASETTWAKVNSGQDYEVLRKTVAQGHAIEGNPEGDVWSVPEVDVKMLAGWFWRDSAGDNTTKSDSALAKIYFDSVGRGATLLLNLSPNKEGTIGEQQMNAFKKLGQNIKDTFAVDMTKAEGVTAKATSVWGDSKAYSASQVLDEIPEGKVYDETYWAPAEGQTSGSLEIDLGGMKTFDLVSLEEYIQKGQTIKSFTIEYKNAIGRWEEFATGTTISSLRLCRRSAVTGSAIRVTINDAYSTPMLVNVGVHKMVEDFEVAEEDNGPAMPTNLSFKAITEFTLTENNNGTWTKENNNTSAWSNSNKGGVAEFKFTGTQAWIIGTIDPQHGTMDVYIDGEKITSVNTHSTVRKMNALLYTTPELEDKEHTIKIVCTQNAIGLGGAYYQDGSGVFTLSHETMSMIYGETAEIQILREGGSKGQVEVTYYTESSGAEQGVDYVNLTETVVFEEGETEKTITLTGIINDRNVDGKDFFFTIGDAQKIVNGEKQPASVLEPEYAHVRLYLADSEVILENAKNVDTSGYSKESVEALEEAIAVLEAAHNSELATESALREAAKAVLDAQNALVVSSGAEDGEEGIFTFPVLVDEEKVLEAESFTLDASGAADPNKYVRIATKDWDGKQIQAVDWFENGNKIKLSFYAEEAGTYTFTATYRSGRAEGNPNAFVWSGTNVTAGEKTVFGENNATTTHTVDLPIVITAAGEGELIFSADGRGGPVIDKFNVKFADATSTERAVSGVTLNQEELHLTNERQSAILIAKVLPKDATNKEVTFTSSAPEVIAVDNYGVVKALQSGEATITATTVDGEFTATCTVTAEIKVTPEGGDQGGDNTDEPGGEQPGGETPEGGQQSGGNNNQGTQQPGGNNNQGTQQPGGQQPGGNNNQGTQQPGGNNNQGTQQPSGSSQEEQKEIQAEKNTLNKALDTAKKTPASTYTKESYDAFQKALQAAEAIAKNPNATKKQLVDAQLALQSAISALKPAEVEKPQESTKPGTEFKDPKGIYQFKIKNETEAVFTGVAQSIKTVKIANTITYGGKTFKVTSVAAKALKGDKVVTKITVGKNVKDIGASAFEGCTKLTSISLGNSTEKIGNKALKGCTALKKVTIPKKVTNLGKSVFEGCKKLATVTVKATGLKKVGKNTFKNISAKAKIKVPKKNLAKYKKLLKNKGQGKKVSVK